MKKFKLRKRRHKIQKVYTPTEFLTLFVNAELRPYGITIDDIKTKENGLINGTPWYNYYTFKTESQENVWRDYCSKIYRRHAYSHYIPKRQFKKEFSWFALMYGLTSEYLINKHKEEKESKNNISEINEN